MSDYTVLIPDSVPDVGIVIGKGGRNLSLIAGQDGAVKIIPRCDAKPRKLIVKASSPERFRAVERKLQRLFEYCSSQVSFSLAPIWMFLYSEGKDVQNEMSCFEFQVYSGRLLSHAVKESSYYLCYSDKEAEDHQDDSDTNTSSPFHFLSIEQKIDEHTADHRYELLKKSFSSSTEYTAIAEALHEYIRLISGGNAGKLEARFGKRLWSKLPPEILDTCTRLSLNEVVNFFESTCNHKQRYGSFHPSIEPIQIETISKELENTFHANKHRIETYDLKSSIFGSKVDVRVMVEDGNLKIIRVIRNEKRIASLDFIPIRMKHDYRLSISEQEIVHEGDLCFKTAQMMVDTCNLIMTNELSLTPLTDEWLIDFIRHKTRDSYILDGVHLVTISEVFEYDVKGWSHNQGEQISLQRSKDSHWELELNNILWECAFGQAVGLSTEETLSLYMMYPSLDDAVKKKVQGPLHPESLITHGALKDFFEILNWINEQLV